MNKIKNLFRKYKILILVLVLIAFTCFIVCLPSLGKFKNRNTVYTTSSWDGTIATNYQKGDGTKDNPYIISNGSEFAFFIEQLKTTDYANTYFELSNDIVINSGVFDYNETEGLKYTFEDITYYVKENTNEYYVNSEMQGNSVGVLNNISMINSFKGNLNGNSFTIYGIYMNDSTNENLALFKNLEGTINNLYITNSVVYGKGNVAGVAINSKNSKLTNFIYDGFVVNKSMSKLVENDLDLVSVNATTLESTETIILPDVSINGLIKNIKLTGEYSVSNSNSKNIIKINNIDISQTNNFEIDLGKNLLSEISIVTSTDMEGTSIEFKNLKYKVEYSDDITAGIILDSTNTTINNLVNKADIYGNYISSGLIGKENAILEINQSYNKGNIKSNYIASGIVGLIKDNQNNINISNVYNTGTIISNTSGAIISILENNTGEIEINNSINISDNYFINTILNTSVNVDNSYSLNSLNVYSGTITGSIFQTTTDVLYTSDFLKTLSYDEFINYETIETETTKVWVYEKNAMPILYIDDLNNPVAKISIGKYSWNNLSSELNTIEINNNIEFSIDEASNINPIEKYYYIANSQIALTEEELNNIKWTKYDENVSIETSGYYVVYVKIVDSDGDITYMNTDILKFNKSGFQKKITMGDIIWSNLKTDLDNIYINKDINLTIDAHDDLTPINSIEYYLSNKELTEEELNSITEWNLYTNYITINTPGKYVVYAKIVDSESNITYLNTDYLLYNGYKETVTFGNTKINDTNYITDKSSLKLAFESDFEITYKEGDTHNLISNILLPVGTKITLIDKNNSKVYRKIIDSEEDIYGYSQSCDGKTSCSKYATYSFNIFNEIGMKKDVYYDETVNIGKTLTNEKYIITIDFENTNLVDNYYDLSFYLAIKNSSNEFLYQTLNNTIKSVNVYTNTNGSDILTTHNLNSDYTNQSINYNSDSELNINFSNQITYTMINNKNIIDTNYLNKKAGILLKLYNSAGEEISKKYLDNMIFEVGGKEFFANNDNSIIINLGSISNTDIKTLKIKTKPNSSGLENGIYYIKLNKFLSNDGYNIDVLYEDEIQIPLIVDNYVEIIPKYSFDVKMDSSAIMLDKKVEEQKVSFNLLYSGTFTNPNVKVSLWEKKKEGSKNQEYVLIDFAEYIKEGETIVLSETNKYFVDITKPLFELNIVPKKLNYNGYKYVFELYDGTKKIGKIEKNFIVR